MLCPKTNETIFACESSGVLRTSFSGFFPYSKGKALGKRLECSGYHANKTVQLVPAGSKTLRVRIILRLYTLLSIPANLSFHDTVLFLETAWVEQYTKITSSWTRSFHCVASLS